MKDEHGPDEEMAAQAKAGRKRRRRLAVLLALALAFFVSSAAAGYYAITKRPLASLPGVSLVAKGIPPRYVFSIVGVETPEAVAVSQDGERIYVAESGGDRVVKVFDRNGRLLQTLEPPYSMVALRLPAAVAIGPEGRIYVSDRLRVAIDIYNPDGSFYGSYRPEAVLDEPWLPMGLAFDARSRLLITDHRQGKHRVLVFRPNEYLDTAFGEEGAGAGQFAFPNSAAVDSEGRIYVSDSNNARVSVFDSKGSPVAEITALDPKSSLGMPRGLAIDSLDRLHVVDTSGHYVAVYQAGDRPAFLFTFGELGTNPGEFRYPSGLALDKTGRIYVADRNNNLVSVWSY